MNDASKTSENLLSMSQEDIDKTYRNLGIDPQQADTPWQRPATQCEAGHSQSLFTLRTSLNTVTTATQEGF